MGVRAKDLSVRVGSQSDRTTVAGSLTDIAVPADGDGMNADLSLETLDTDHGNEGVLYSSVGSRNGESKSFRSFLFPNVANLLMDNVITRDASGDQSFLTIESWWGTKLGASKVKGQRRYGCIFDSFSFQIDRTGAGAPIEVDFGGWINRKQNIPTGESVPTLDFSDVLPYSSTGVKIDFVPDAAGGAYGGHVTDVRRLSVTYSNQGAVEEFQDNDSNVELDKVWTIHTPGEASAQFEITMALNEEEYLQLDENEEPPKGKLRVVFTHPKGATETSGSTLTSGDQNTQTLLVDSTTGFVVGDVVYIEHPVTGFAVLPISAIVADESISVDTDTGGGTGSDSRVTLNGASGGLLTIRNMAQVLIFDRIDYRGSSAITRDGNKRVVTLTYEAALLSGATSIMEAHTYDHSNSHA